MRNSDRNKCSGFIDIDTSRVLFQEISKRDIGSCCSLIAGDLDLPRLIVIGFISVSLQSKWTSREPLYLNNISLRDRVNTLYFQLP